MFSGIIEKQAQVARADRIEGHLEIDLMVGWRDISIGESIAVNGVCLTVTGSGQGLASFFVSPETLNCSNLGNLSVGQVANLERAVFANSRLSGHIVQGHVDGLAQLESRSLINGAWEHLFLLPEKLGRCCVEKGSIALNGISLTINKVECASGARRIYITVIPHTWESTNLSALSVGGELNVEIDVMAKYVERLCKPYIKL